jgi:hypothetical protein
MMTRILIPPSRTLWWQALKTADQELTLNTTASNSLTPQETFASHRIIGIATRYSGPLWCSARSRWPAGAEPSANEMHFTYASPAAEFYRKNGRFDDGTVLVKEGSPPVMRRCQRATLTGPMARLGLLHVWPSSTAVRADLGRGPVAECVGCHIVNVAKTDMTWVQFYPLLRDKPGY